MMKGNLSNRARDREGDLNIVVQRCLIFVGTFLTNIRGMQLVHMTEALNDVSTHGAHQMPFHFEQPQLCTVEEQVNGFDLCNPPFCCELDWVDSEETVIIAGTYQGLEFGNHTWQPGAGAFQLA